MRVGSKLVADVGSWIQAYARSQEFSNECSKLVGDDCSKLVADEGSKLVADEVSWIVADGGSQECSNEGNLFADEGSWMGV